MSDLEIVARLMLAIGFGAILGLETETRTSQEQKDLPINKISRVRYRLGGVRTYTILSLFGAMGGLLYSGGQPVFGYLIFGAIFLIVLAAYILNVQYQKAFGITTEIAVMIAALVGFMSTAEILSMQVLLVIVIVLTFILSQKQMIGLLVKRVEHNELIDVLKFTIVAVVILPFLPNVDMRLVDLSFVQQLVDSGQMSAQLGAISFINPFKLWQYVVLISGFSLLGYFASKLFGRTKGLVMTAIFGGLMSSTSTVIAMAEQSRSSNTTSESRSLAGVGLLAHAVSFLQILVLALSTGVFFFQGILVMSIVMALTSGLVGFAFIWFNRNEPQVELAHKPFSINLAVKFAILLTVVKVVVQVVEVNFGPSAFAFFTAGSGTVGMDVSTITLGELVTKASIPLGLAVLTYFAANAVNFAAKGIYAYWQGSREFAKVTILGLVIGLIAALGTLLV